MNPEPSEELINDIAYALCDEYFVPSLEKGRQVARGLVAYPAIAERLRSMSTEVAVAAAISEERKRIGAAIIEYRKAELPEWLRAIVFGDPS